MIMNVPPQIKLVKLGDRLRYNILHRNLLSSCSLQILHPSFLQYVSLDLFRFERTSFTAFSLWIK